MADREDRQLHVVTFITATGRRCYYATRVRHGDRGELEHLRFPGQIQVQLDALGARVAWWCINPHGLCVRGDASDLCSPVRTADQLDHLVFL